MHHGSDPEYLDKNYAGILIIWDRLFGTYAEETHRPTYGLTKNVDTVQPVPAAVPRVRAPSSATSARHGRGASALGYLFAPPGWAPARHEVEPQPAAVRG